MNGKLFGPGFFCQIYGYRNPGLDLCDEIWVKIMTQRIPCHLNRIPGKPSVPFFEATVAGFRGKVDGN